VRGGNSNNLHQQRADVDGKTKGKDEAPWKGKKTANRTEKLLARVKERMRSQQEERERSVLPGTEGRGGGGTILV